VIRRRLAAIAVAALGLPSAAAATDRSETFDAPGQKHTNLCARLASSPASLRFPDGTANGFSVSNGLAFESGPCTAGTVRIDFHETIPSPLGPLVFHRGGSGYVDAQNVKYGELPASALAGDLPAPWPSSGGRGAPCRLADEPAYEARVRSIPSEMKYKRPQDVPSGNTSGATFMHYGDPGADQGDRRDIHYSYLTWSWVNVSGGGMVRTLIAPGAVMRACDVAPITMSSWDKQGAVNGRVTARYVRIVAGNCPLYGWVAWTHELFGDGVGPVAHATALAGAPPPEPAPGGDCPLSAPARPPSVATGRASVAADGAVTLAGTVDPVGVPTRWSFEVQGAASTAAGSLAASDTDVPVSGKVTGLRPGTLYSYRLVASNTHGPSNGDYGTFKLPDAATFAPPVLSRLRVTPRSFRRARSRRGGGAHIRLKLSRRATVTFRFLRRLRGGHRVRRVRGSLRVRLRPGTRSVRFGGWVGRRALARGGYRLVATPADGARRGVAHTASFRIR
jgi:hypothetical protein